MHAVAMRIDRVNGRTLGVRKRSRRTTRADFFNLPCNIYVYYRHGINSWPLSRSFLAGYWPSPANCPIPAYVRSQVGKRCSRTPTVAFKPRIPQLYVFEGVGIVRMICARVHITLCSQWSRRFPRDVPNPWTIVHGSAHGYFTARISRMQT